jgi:hypothetical protein
MNLLIIFVALSIVNVVFSTIKSIVTIKSGPWVASIVSALYYGYYNIVLIYTVADFPLWQKVAVTAGCNLVGVFIVKYGEQKARKDKLWKVELTVPTKYKDTIDFDLHDVPHSYIELSDKHTLFNFYCATQVDSAKVKAIADDYEAKYFVAESKNL